MIQFSCPRCQTALSAKDEQAGSKVNCPKCKQKLQVPQSELDRTMIARPMPQTAGGPQPDPRAKQSATDDKDDKAPATPPPVTTGPAQPISAMINPQLKVAQWYYTRTGKQCGPVGWPQLRFLTATGEVPPTERVWTKGMTNWTLASAVQGLFPLASGPVHRVRNRKKVWIWAGVTVVALAAAIALWVILKKPGDLTEKEVVAKVGKSIALIETPSGGGSGFIVLPGILATNAHVVEGVHSKDIKIRFPSAGEAGKKAITANSVLLYDRKRDLAFVALQTDLPPLEIAKDFKFEKGDRIMAIGSPGALGGRIENAVTSGVLSSKTKFQDQDYYQVSLAINPGNSGGPVLNSHGEVIGVATLKATGTEQLNFCIPVEDLRKRIDSVSKIHQEEYDQKTSDYNASTVFRRIVRARMLYAYGLTKIGEAWERANRSGKGPLPKGELEAAKEAVLETFKKSPVGRYYFVNDLKDVMPQVGSDRLIKPPETRQRLVDLWLSFITLHDLFLEPWDARTLENYARTLNDSLKRQAELIANLKNTLGVKDEELKLD